MTTYRMLNDYTIKATDDLTESREEWGQPRLSRIFNFRARQITTLYERGGTREFQIPRGGSSFATETGYTAAVAGAMQIQNFSDLESGDEVAEMHKKLADLGGNPPPLEEVLPNAPVKKSAGLRAPFGG